MDWTVKVAEAANNHLLKTCPKLDPTQWTVMAAILNENLEVVCMSTGIKCMPECKLTQNGRLLPLYYDTVRDMHAEVLCRRALIRYHLLNPQVSLDARYHLYVTKVPCGDCSLPTDQCRDDEWHKSRRNHSSMARGKEDWSRRGVVRTKPGRADSPPTKSVSCSDKLALWNAIGWQGHYLGTVCRFSSIIIDDPRADQDHCVKALLERVGLTTDTVNIYTINTGLFKYGDESNSRCPQSIIWHLGMTKAEVLIEGRKLGSAPSRCGRLHPKSISIVATSTLESLLPALIHNDWYEEEKSRVIEAYLRDWPRADYKYN